MIASLPMYDWPEVRKATDQFWTGFCRYLGLKIELTRSSDCTTAWRAQDLLFSQTCGYPYTHGFRNLALVATPHYAAPGCQGAHYCSLLFARERHEPEFFRGKTAAINSPDSMSGMLALKAAFYRHARDGVFFGKAIETGGHLASLTAVRQGKADICAIDAVVVAMARRYRPQDLQGLVEIGRSPSVPGLPFVTVAGDIGALRTALTKAFEDPALKAARDALLLTGFSVLRPEDYHAILMLEQRIEASGGLKLL